MKKSLIALAALATVATAAQAQSSVTVYGIMDLGVVSVSGAQAGRVTDVGTGGLATSRLGFKGTEDLGGGLKANFNLESGLTADTGAVNTTTMFDRQSWVGLEDSNVGVVQLGRTTRLDFDTTVAGDAMGAAGFGSAGQGLGFNLLSASGGPTTSSANRYANSIKATSARVAGFTVAYQHAFGGSAGNDSISQGTAFALDYTAGKAKLTYAYSRQNNTTNGDKASDTSVVTGSYDFGVAKLFAGNGQTEVVGNAPKTKITWVGFTAPVSAKVNVMAQYYDINNQGQTDAKDANAFVVGATYDLSKRTALYLMGGRVKNDGTATVGLLGSAAGTGVTVTQEAGKNQTGYTAGIRHSF